MSDHKKSVKKLTVGAGHGNDIPLKRPVRYAPLALIDNERRLSVRARILIRLRNNPSGSIRHALRKIIERNIE